MNLKIIPYIEVYKMSNELKIYCKFDDTKEEITTVISNIFSEFAENKNVQIKNSQNSQNDNTDLK